jgi:hypothetical protein
MDVIGDDDFRQRLGIKSMCVDAANSLFVHGVWEYEVTEGVWEPGWDRSEIFKFEFDKDVYAAGYTHFAKTELSLESYIAASSDGSIAVADTTNNKVFVISKDGVTTHDFEAEEPIGMAIIDNGLVFSSRNNILTYTLGRDKHVLAYWYHHEPSEPLIFGSISGLVVLRDQSLVICSKNGRIYHEKGSFVPGKGPSLDNLPLTLIEAGGDSHDGEFAAATFYDPEDIDVDADDNILICQGSCLLRLINLKERRVSTIHQNKHDKTTTTVVWPKNTPREHFEDERNARDPHATIDMFGHVIFECATFGQRRDKTKRHMETNCLFPSQFGRTIVPHFGKKHMFNFNRGDGTDIVFGLG